MVSHKAISLTILGMKFNFYLTLRLDSTHVFYF